MQLNWRLHDGNGPHLLMVHGFLSSAAQWQDNLAALAPEFRCLTVELLGHGDSPAPDDPNAYRPEAYTAAFEALRHQLGIERWFTLGYSLGAGLTLNHALSHPRHLLGTAFTNSNSAFASPAGVDKMVAGTASSIRQLQSLGAPAIERLAVHPRRAKSLPASTRTALLEDAKKLHPGAIAQTLAITLPNASVYDRAHQLELPALMLHGIKERRFGPLADYARSTLPNLTTVELNAGHGVNMEQPKAFNQALCQFKQRCLQ